MLLCSTHNSQGFWVKNLYWRFLTDDYSSLMIHKLWIRSALANRTPRLWSHPKHPQSGSPWNSVNGRFAFRLPKFVWSSLRCKLCTTNTIWIMYISFALPLCCRRVAFVFLLCEPFHRNILSCKWLKPRKINDQTEFPLETFQLNHSKKDQSNPLFLMRFTF